MKNPHSFAVGVLLGGVDIYASEEAALAAADDAPEVVTAVTFSSNLVRKCLMVCAADAAEIQ